MGILLPMSGRQKLQYPFLDLLQTIVVSFKNFPGCFMSRLSVDDFFQGRSAIQSR